MSIVDIKTIGFGVVAACLACAIGASGEVERLSPQVLPASVAGRAAAAPAGSADDASLELAGQIGGAARAIAVAGNRAYLGVGPRLLVIDIADPDEPAQVGQSAPLGGVVADVVVRDRKAYVVAGEAGLHILDVSGNGDPPELSHAEVEGHTTAVDVTGRTAYVTAHPSGLHAYDVSDPFRPRRLGTFAGVPAACDVAVSDARAFVAQAGTGSMRCKWGMALEVVDVRDPTDMIRLGVAEDTYAVAVAVRGTHAFATDRSGLQVLDVEDPAAPIVVAEHPVQGRPLGVHLDGDTVYLTLGSDTPGTWGFVALDVREPRRPAQVSTWFAADSPVFAVANSGFIVCAAVESHGLQVLDMEAQAAMPARRGRWRTLAGTKSVAAADGQVYAAAGRGGVAVVDIDESGTPRLVGVMGGGLTQYSAVAVEPSPVPERAYALSWYADERGVDLVEIDVTDPTRPQRMSTTLAALNEKDRGALVVDHYHVYVMDNGGIAREGQPAGLRTFALVEGFGPFEVGFLPTGFSSYRPVIDGDRLYTASGPEGLRVFDLADPTSLVDVSDGPQTPGFTQGLSLVSRGVVAAAAQDSLKLVEVPQSGPIEVVGETPSRSGSALRVAVSGPWAYLATADAVELVDINVRSEPRVVDVFDSEWPPWSYDIAASGDLAFVATRDSGLWVLKRRDGDEPRPTATVAATPTDTPAPLASSTPTPVWRTAVYLAVAAKGE